ncbi:MAG: hypothetical protein KatS3mg081_1645 [Gemmatimonadales bacterium]|nr:MAG: hypothetical protein KatS3mg081_1645 [Gemmatimonadales bacterium]
MAVSRSAAIAAVLLAAGCAATEARAQEAEGFFELRVSEGPREIVTVLVRDSMVLLPARRVLELLEVRIDSFAAGRMLAASLQPEGVVLLFDVQQGVVQGMAGRGPLPESGAVWRGAELFVETGLLASTLGVLWNMDFSALVIDFSQTGHLPLVRRLRRARQREALARQERMRPLEVSPRRASLDGAVLDWRLISGTRDPLSSSTLDLALGVQLLGGGLSVEQSVQSGPLGVSSRFGGSWFKAWPEGSRVRQLGVGDVLGFGRESRPLRGIALSNAPFLRPAEFGMEVFTGRLGPGWEVELYRGGELLRYEPVAEDGTYRFSVPVIYGANSLQAVGYGPHGELIRRELMVELSPRMLPAKKFEYGISLGECRNPLCDHLVQADMRYGALDRLTLQAGLEAFRNDSLGWAWHPYAALTGMPHRSLSLGADLVLNGFLRFRGDLVTSSDFQLRVQHTRFDTSITVPVLHSGFQLHRTELSWFWRPRWLGGGTFVQAAASASAVPGGTQTQFRVASVSRLGNLRVTGAFQRVATSAGAVSFASQTLELQGDAVVSRWPRQLAGTLITARLQLDPDSGLMAGVLGFGKRVMPALRVDLQGGWRRHSGVSLDLSLTASAPYARATSRNFYSSQTGVQGTQLVEGSLLWDSGAQVVRLGGGRLSGRTAMAGVVFVDENGNGRHDPGELAVQAVRLTVGSRSVLTDSLGRFQANDLVPFEETIVEIDTLSLANPLWIPAALAYSVRPGPNAVTYVEIPLVAGGEVSGWVRFEDSGTGVAGVRVVLEELETGSVREMVTFSDGAFYAMGLRPGRYRLSIDAEQAGVMGWEVGATELVIDPSTAGRTLENVELRVRRRP